MKRLHRTPLSKITLLAFATSLIVIPAAAAYPVIDPDSSSAPPTLASTGDQSLTDGWYSAALQQTRLNAAKKAAATSYRSSDPTLPHGPVLP